MDADLLRTLGIDPVGSYWVDTFRDDFLVVVRQLPSRMPSTVEVSPTCARRPGGGAPLTILTDDGMAG